MNTPRHPLPAVLFAATLAAGVLLSPLAGAVAGPQPAHRGPAPAAVGAGSPLATPPALPTPTPEEAGWELATSPDSFFRLRLPPGWYASFSDPSIVEIDNYDPRAFDRRPKYGINIRVSLGERSFPQTFEQFVAEWKENESSDAPGAYPTPIPMTPFQPITVAGYGGVSEIIKVAMDNGEQWPIQSILLDVERRWIGGISIKPALSRDYDQALRILGTLEISPRCEEVIDPYLGLDPTLGPAANLRAQFETIVARELEARQTENWPAFLSLVHEETDPQWLAQQRSQLGPEWESIALTRIERSQLGPEWAVAAAIETHIADGAGPTQYYTARVFRQAAATGCWELTAPTSEPWAKGNSGGWSPPGNGLKFGAVGMSFPTFDEPYVRAIGPRIVRVLPQMAADFDVFVAENKEYWVSISPFPEWQDPNVCCGVRRPGIPSPLWPGFPIDLAQSPEEYLLGSLTDLLGHTLLEDDYGDLAQEPARLALAHAAVQWEVEQATGRDATLRLVEASAGERTPLAVLLDPLRVDATGAKTAERDLFLRFAIAEQGRSVIAPYLQAVFHRDSAAEVVAAVFDQESPAVEQRWRAWRDQLDSVGARGTAGTTSLAP